MGGGKRGVEDGRVGGLRGGVRIWGWKEGVERSDKEMERWKK